jgi:carbon storage regulator
MLVLTRKKNESIIIDDDIEIFVVEVRGDKVRLGITAPRERSVHRREVYDQIQAGTAPAKPCGVPRTVSGRGH